MPFRWKCDKGKLLRWSLHPFLCRSCHFSVSKNNYSVHDGQNVFVNFSASLHNQSKSCAPGLEKHQHFQEIGVLINCEHFLGGMSHYIWSSHSIFRRFQILYGKLFNFDYPNDVLPAFFVDQNIGVIFFNHLLDFLLSNHFLFLNHEEIFDIYHHISHSISSQIQSWSQ